MRGLHYETKTVSSIAPIAAGTTGTGRTGVIVDRRGWRNAELICSYGAVTATAATFTVTLLHGDATGAMASVADADMEGTEAGVALGQAVRTDGVGDNLSKRLGYKGNKRYLQAKIVNTATAATPVAATFLLSEPEVAPRTSQAQA